MPRTRSKKVDDRTPLEKVQNIESKIDMLIFLTYFDGLSTGGAVGFDVNAGPAGSTKHRTGVLKDALTVNQFRSKGKRLAQLAKDFIEKESEQPPHHLRPVFTADEIKDIQDSNKDKRTPEEKFLEIKDDLELFVFLNTMTDWLRKVKLDSAKAQEHRAVLITKTAIEGCSLNGQIPNFVIEPSCWQMLQRNASSMALYPHVIFVPLQASNLFLRV